MRKTRLKRKAPQVTALLLLLLLLIVIVVVAIAIVIIITITIIGITIIIRKIATQSAGLARWRDLPQAALYVAHCVFSGPSQDHSAGTAAAAGVGGQQAFTSSDAANKWHACHGSCT